MTALQNSLIEYEIRRGEEIERRSDGAPIPGGGAVGNASVRATWVRLDNSGAGIVSYQGKEYVVVPRGAASIPQGTTVMLSYADGLYFADF